MKLIAATIRTTLAATSLLAMVGCTTVPRWANHWPFVEADRTTYRTPAMRIDAIEQFATRATGVDTPDQRELTDQLARQIQVEPDPLARKAIVESIAQFRTPLAGQVLSAALADSDESVRIATCLALGERAEPAAVTPLARALRDDKSIDVRLAAADALGNIKSPEAIQALTAALEDRDPAMQYAGVESMRSITGRDLGGDVEAWRQFAENATPEDIGGEISVAERLRRLSPF